MVLSKLTLRHQLYGVAGLFLVPVALVNLLILAVLDYVLRLMGLGRDANPWAWGLILFAANLVMLLVALWALGRSARQKRLAERRIVARMDDVKPTLPVTASTN